MQRTMTTQDKIIEEIETKEDYKRFSEFWEKARNITDEDGDNFLTWDKSNISHLSFSRGYDLGIQSQKQKIIKIIKEHLLSTYPVNCKAIIEEINNDKSRI